MEYFSIICQEFPITRKILLTRLSDHLQAFKGQTRRLKFCKVTEVKKLLVPVIV